MAHCEAGHKVQNEGQETGRGQLELPSPNTHDKHETPVLVRPFLIHGKE
jgi:hypothetical protein